MSVYTEIQNEREYQNKRFGTTFDDKNNPYNWAAYIGQYATRNLIGDPTAVVKADFRTSMVKVAALAVAAVEALDRSEATV